VSEDKVIITSDGKHRLYWCAECGTRRLGSVHRLPKGWIRKRKIFDRVVWCYECRGTVAKDHEGGEIERREQSKRPAKGNGYSVFRVGHRRRVGKKR